VVSKDLEFYAERVLGNAEVAVEARLIRSEVDRCRGILQQMSVRGAEPIGETPVPLGLGEALGSVKQAFAPPERTWSKRKLPGKAGRWLFLPTHPAGAHRAGEKRAGRRRWQSPGIAHRGVRRRKAALHRPGFGLRHAARDARRVAEPFFTTKPPGRGMA